MRTRAQWFRLIEAFFKPIGLFAGGLYLFGFGLYPYLAHDFLLPFEKVGCLVLGFCFLIWFAISYHDLWIILRRS